jgi:hypothetical protein
VGDVDFLGVVSRGKKRHLARASQGGQYVVNGADWITAAQNHGSFCW